ncbi:ExeM/NucH family extracellular endonuclease [Nocardioides caeni]|uniref:ExeM/NucH family extracellular endonuclease n=1 Tax=Nocardioides caeni TaxID=574700 RepID=A0A4S8NLJ3_9ACTN|nr:ExeM/NucH family extracellular endonuclease [Nocardioides caeni]THV15904.1 ExeM/NucH family extracellular endonuclease [Nocardioides caeni]
MRSSKQFLFGSLGVALAVSGLTALGAVPVQASVSTKIADFPYSQNWSNAGLITTNDDWSGVTGVEGYLGDYTGSSPTAVDPRTLTAETLGVTDVIANNAAALNTLSSGGVIESEFNQAIALQGSGTADAPNLAFHLDLTGQPGATLAFNARDLDGSADDAVQPIAVQYRVGNSGDFTNLPAGYIADATDPGTATKVTPVSVTLPGDAAGAADVYVRVLTTNAVGNDEWVGIDDVSVTTDGEVEPDPLAATDPGDKTYTQNQAITPLQLAATGGTPPYEWAVTGGTLPDGLELSASGLLTGTPTTVTPAPVEITVTATDDVDATSEATFTITVAEPLAITPIAELQGTGARSPFAPESGNGTGDDVKSTEGVVTAAYYTGGFNGLYIQTPGADTTDASDGIFVYGGSTNGNLPAGLEVGDSVRVTGRIAEFFDLTQIVPSSASAVTELETSLGVVTPRAIAYPTTAEERELREGELLAPSDDFTVSNNYSTNQYGEIGLATGDLPLRQPTEFADDDDQAALDVIDADNLARGVVLDDGATTNFLSNQSTKALPVPYLTVTGGTANPNPPRVGGPADLHAPVILDWRNNAWKFQPQGQVVLNGADVVTFGTDRADNLTPIDVLGADGDVKIATFNVLNYFNTTGEAYAASGPLQNPPLDTFCTYYTDRGPGGDNGTDASDRIGNNSCGVRLLDDPSTPANEATTNDGRGPRGAATSASLTRQETKLANTIVAMDADVIGLEEIENSIKLPGEANRDDAVANLVALLNAVEGPGTWKYVKSPGESTTASAVAEQDVIRSAFIYKPAAVSPVGQSDILFGTDEFANAREPLAQAFKKTGGLDSDAFAVIVNHFKSKGDNQSPAPPADGDNTNSPYFGAFNGDRTRQATRLLEFADDFAADRGIDAVFLAGDFNSYSEEDPITVLEQGGFELVESTDDPAEESYSFSGYSGSLDHVLGNEAAVGLVTGADIWEINANEAISYQYSRYNYNVTNFWEPTLPFGTSDHNPEVVGLDLPDATEPSYKEIQVVGTNDFHGRLLPDGGNAAGAAPFATAVEELRTDNPNTVFVAAGDLVGASTFESFVQDDEPTIEALNAMGLEVSAAGNHEFDRGYADLEGRIRDLADWQYIASNLDYAGIPTEDQLAETWVKEIDGERIGFVGAVTEDLPALVNPTGIEGITVTDIVDATNAAAASLRSAENPGGPVDLVVLLVHEGSPTTDCASASFTDPATVWGNVVQNTSADVDAIISGHTHLAYNCKYPVADWADEGRAVTQRPVVSAGQYGSNLNRLVFKFDEGTGELAVIDQDIIATAGVGYEADPTVQAIVDDAVDFAEEKGNDVLGQMDGSFKRASYTSSAGATENRGGESTLSNQVAEVQRWATEEAGVPTDIAFMNPGGLRADMLGSANGGDPTLQDLTYRQAADVQPFANTLVNLKLTGAQLETVLEQQWQRTATGGVPSRPFLRLGVSEGFTYTYVEAPVKVEAPNSAPVNTFAGEVTGMWLNGEPVDAAATYSVTVNSFLGGGGDNFWEFANGTGKVDTGQVDLQAMVDYMGQYDEANPLPVDYAQRAVELTFPEAAPATYGEGDTLAFDVASWSMTAAGDVQDTQLELRNGDTVLGTFPVTNTAGTTPYDNAGTASVSVTVPDLPDGVQELTLHGPATGTSIPVLIEVDDVMDVQIVGTNDFHGRLLVDESPATATCDTVLCPAAVLSGTVKQMRSENPNTVFVAAGDLIGASTFESFIQDDEPTIDVLNEAGLEVSAAGNHEFDQGYEDLVGRVQDHADWEYLAANVEEPEGRDDLAETWTKEFGDITVGFVGAVTEELPSLVSPDGIEGLTVTDIVDATNAAAADLRAGGADVVVLLVHEGSPSVDCASPNFTSEGTVWGNISQNVSSDVDAIVSGHTHLAYNCSLPVQDWVDEERSVTERPVVSAGQYGQNLNKLVFSVDTETGEVVAKTQSIVALNASSPSDPAVETIVNDAKAVAEVQGAVKIGELAAPFNRARVTGSTDPNRGGESTLSNQVAEVQRWATEKPESGSAQIAFMNPGGLRSDMAGQLDGDTRELTYKGAAVVQPFANTLVNMDLTGAQIETVLEQQWQRQANGTVPTRPFLRLGVSRGFTYTYTETPTTVSGTATFEGEVTGMWLDGEPIDPAATYSVTVNSFLGSGGDNFREFANGTGKADTGKIDLAAMVDYMAAFAATEPLPVDYSQRAVEVEFPANAPESYEPGGEAAFAVGSLAMTAPGDVTDDEIVVTLGDEQLGTFTVDNTVGTERYDSYGTAAVDVTLPADLTEGPAVLTLTGAETGTEVLVPIEVVEPLPVIVNYAAPKVTGTPRMGKTVTADEGTWAPEPTGYAYRWFAGGVEIAGETGRTLKLRKPQIGKRITVEVTASADGYAEASLTSAPSAVVAKAAVTVSARVAPSPVIVNRSSVAVGIRVTNPDGLTVAGQVTVKVAGKTVTGRLVDGRVTIRIGRMPTTGLKRVYVTYLGNAVMAARRVITSFTVVRR